MKLVKYMGLGAAMLLMASCTSKFEEYNTNPYEPTTVPAVDLLSKMFEVYASSQQNSCQMNNTMWGCHSGQVTTPTTWNKGENLFAYYNPAFNFNEATFNDFNGKILTNLFKIETLTNKQGTVYALAQLTRVFAMMRVACLQGPLPYTQIKQGVTAVAYDDEPTAWHAMFDDLDASIAVLKSLNGQVYASLVSVDQFFNGDTGKWLRFANTLKLRMAIRISGIEPEFAKQKAEEAVADGVMASVEDSAWDTTNSNQGVNGYSVVDGWGEVRANACLVSYMNGYNDPRRAKYFTEQKVNNQGGYIGVRSGTASAPSPAIYDKYSRLLIATNKQAPQPVMYAAEAAFLRAEGALKGWNMGGTAQKFYEEGIKLSFQEFGVESALDKYLADDKSKPANYTDPQGKSNDDYINKSTVTIKWDEKATEAQKLERILTQKWIACFLDPMMGWADYRRTGYPQIFPAHHSANQSCTIARGQRRIQFAQSEYNTNKVNVEAAVKMVRGGVDSNGADLWWAMKENGKY